MSKELLINNQEEIVSFKDEVRFVDPRSKKEFLAVMKVENEEINNKKCIGSLAKVNVYATIAFSSKHSTKSNQ